ncbi:MAG: VCBS repeat-containing protein [Verrucomicrobiota bacterium]
MPVKWKKVWIADEGYESVGVFDVNNDGVLDIVSGAFWYQGPDFRQKHSIGPVGKYGEYYDDFSTIALDVNGDGYLDFVTGGWWGNTLRWRENPQGDPKKEWPEHIIAEVGNVETTRAWDIDGDGQIEILPNTPGNPEVAYYKLITDQNGKGTGKFRKVPVYNFGKGCPNHGLGCGDVAGNGRMDILFLTGWLEAPANPETGKWIWHEEFLDAPWKAKGASIPMLVVDLNGDGKNEIITGSPHGYGLWWSERQAGGWKHHPIDPYNAQYHDLQWVDIDGDGQCELVTGKRHRAHCGHEAGEWDDLGIYYFKWTGECFAKQVIDYGPIGAAKGCGITFATADLRGTGRLDLIAPGKEGLYVFYNEGN